MKYGLILACTAVLSHTGRAADHGPVFGYATPVNSQGEFSFDTGAFIRDGTAGMQFSSGTGVGYGVTPHLSLNAFLPASFGSGRLSESRMMAGSEWSASASWRFLHSVTSVGKRIESTATLGVVVPGPQADSGLLASLHRAPGVTGNTATGLASRSQYAWVGAGFTHFAEAAHTQRPDTFSGSAVYGYRPAKLRRGYDQWDYRGFAELTAEHTTGVLIDGLILPGSGSTTVWVGPSILAIHKSIAIEGGIQAHLMRDVSLPIYGRERFRFAINISYLRYSSHASSH